MKTTLKVLSLLSLALFLTFCKSDPNIEQAKMDLNRQDFDAAIAAAEKAIEMTPESGMGYYYKGLAYKGKASSAETVAGRTEWFEAMIEQFAIANDKFNAMEKVPSEAKNIEQEKVMLWANEFNEAVKIAQSDSLKAIDGKLDQAVAHMDNAKVIMPDSLNNYIVATEVYLMAGQKEDALSSLEYIKDNAADEADANTFLRIALLQKEIASIDAANKTLIQGRERFPENVSLVQQLAQNYLEQEKTDEALAVVKELITIDPDNPQYRLVYGTQLYQSVDVLVDQLNAKYDTLFDLDQEYKKAARISNKAEREQKTAEIEEKRTQVQQDIEEITAKSDDLTAKATTELMKVSELRPNDHDVQYTIAVIYQNKAAALQQQRDNERDNEKAMALDAKAKEQLEKGLQYYEKAAELIENDIAEAGSEEEKVQLMNRQRDYWTALFRVYTNLGMNDKAMDAMEKAGM